LEQDGLGNDCGPGITGTSDGTGSISEGNDNNNLDATVTTTPSSDKDSDKDSPINGLNGFGWLDSTLGYTPGDHSSLDLAFGGFATDLSKGGRDNDQDYSFAGKSVWDGKGWVCFGNELVITAPRSPDPYNLSDIFQTTFDIGAAVITYKVGGDPMNPSYQIPSNISLMTLNKIEKNLNGFTKASLAFTGTTLALDFYVTYQEKGKNAAIHNANIEIASMIAGITVGSIITAVCAIPTLGLDAPVAGYFGVCGGTLVTLGIQDTLERIYGK
jgi:hypothetical protein